MTCVTKAFKDNVLIDALYVITVCPACAIYTATRDRNPKAQPVCTEPREKMYKNWGSQPVQTPRKLNLRLLGPAVEEQAIRTAAASMGRTNPLIQ